DVLLTTPLIRTLRRSFPQAAIDVLVFAGSRRILDGNPDVANVLTMSEHPGVSETAALARRLWRRYDLAISTQTGDRPTIFALMAGRRRAGLVPGPAERGGWWKPRVLDVPVTSVYQSHRLTQLGALARALGLEPATKIVCPAGAAPPGLTPPGPYA